MEMLQQEANYLFNYCKAISDFSYDDANQADLDFIVKLLRFITHLSGHCRKDTINRTEVSNLVVSVLSGLDPCNPSKDFSNCNPIAQNFILNLLILVLSLP